MFALAGDVYFAYRRLKPIVGKLPLRLAQAFGSAKHYTLPAGQARPSRTERMRHACGSRYALAAACTLEEWSRARPAMSAWDYRRDAGRAGRPVRPGERGLHDGQAAQAGSSTSTHPAAENVYRLGSIRRHLCGFPSGKLSALPFLPESYILPLTRTRGVQDGQSPSWSADAIATRRQAEALGEQSVESRCPDRIATKQRSRATGNFGVTPTPQRKVSSPAEVEGEVEGDLAVVAAGELEGGDLEGALDGAEIGDDDLPVADGAVRTRTERSARRRRRP
jgi:hypothetical protein